MKEHGNIYRIELPSGLALIEFSLARVFKEGNRINIPQIINTSGNGSISFRLKKGTYAIKIPYTYNNTTSSNYTNLSFATISTSLGASVQLTIQSIGANASGSGTFLVYLKISEAYTAISACINNLWNIYSISFFENSR